MNTSKLSSAGWLLILLAGCCLAALPRRTPAAPAGDVAVVVHPEVPATDLSLGEVRTILLGDKQYWSKNLRVTLLIRAPVARERDAVLRTIYQMSEAQYRQYWIGKVFRADTASGPKIVYSSDMAVELASNIPGSITFVDTAQIPKGLRVLKIGGRLPGERGYPLH